MGYYTRYPGLRRSSRFRAWLLLPHGFYFRKQISSLASTSARIVRPHGKGMALARARHAKRLIAKLARRFGVSRADVIKIAVRKLDEAEKDERRS